MAIILRISALIFRLQIAQQTVDRVRLLLLLVLGGLGLLLRLEFLFLLHLHGAKVPILLHFRVNAFAAFDLLRLLRLFDGIASDLLLFGALDLLPPRLVVLIDQVLDSEADSRVKSLVLPLIEQPLKCQINPIEFDLLSGALMIDLFAFRLVESCLNGGLDLVRSQFIQHLAQNFHVLAIDLFEHIVDAHRYDVALDLVVFVQLND